MRTVLALVLVVFSLSASAQENDNNPISVAQRAAAAYDAGRYGEAVTLGRRLVELLPRSVSARVRYARALARDGKPSEALAQLESAAEYGMRFDATDAAWNTLRSDPRFQSIESRMRARTAPVVRGETAFLLDKELIPENIVHDPKTGAFFVGSMYKAKIIRIAPDGTITDFVPSRRDGLLSVLGMKIDPARRELWAAAGNFGNSPPLQTPDPASVGKGALYRFNADTGRLIKSYPAPGGTAEQPMTFNDLVLTPQGDVYTTAGLRGIWRLRSGADAVEEFVRPPGEFFNGIAITPDGRTLFAASHFGGVMKIDVATKAWSFIEVPRGVTLAGIDGLYFHDGSLVGIANGTDPQRVIRAWLNPEMDRVTRFAVLEQDHPTWDIPLTGTIVGDQLYYVARSQLRAFDKDKIWPADKLKETVILKLPLEPAGPPAIDLAKERAELLERHRAGIQAHIELNAEVFGDKMANDFISVSQGKIARRTPEETRKFFREYFKGAKYLQYEDVEPPIVRVSDDGSMAWVISRLRVRRTQDGKESGFVYAGIMTFEKRGNDWVRVANVSTFE